MTLQNWIFRAYGVALFLVTLGSLALIGLNAVDLLIRGYLPLAFVESRLIVPQYTAAIMVTLFNLVVWVMVCGALYLGRGIWGNYRRIAAALEALER